MGEVDDRALRDLYRRAKALLFPQIEDFGLVPVEAQATGCPVVAYAAGGALETVTQETGVFFDEQSPEALIGAIERLDGAGVDPEACRRNAERFSSEVFDEAMMGLAREVEKGG